MLQEKDINSLLMEMGKLPKDGKRVQWLHEFARRVADRAIGNARAKHVALANVPTPDLPLTERQMKVLRLAAAGLKNTEIASHLGIAEITVKQYLSRIYTALGVRNRVEAVNVLRGERAPA